MRSHVTKIRLLSFALAALFFLSSCGITPTDTAPTAEISATHKTQIASKLTNVSHENVTLEEMVYERPDVASIRSAIDALQNDIDANKPAEQLMQSYQSLKEQYNHADSMLSLIYLRYAFDVTNPSNREEYASLQSELSVLDSQMQRVSESLFGLSDEVKNLAIQTLGEGFVDSVIENNQSIDPSVQDLEDQEAQLSLEYDNLTATFTYEDNGTDWTYQAIQNDMSLSNDEYHRLNDAYNLALNQEAGKIFQEQIAIRTQIANALKYPDYATYCYINFGRDYSPTDARALHAAVKKYIAPIFVDANKNIDTSDLDATAFDEKTFFDALPTSATAFSPALGGAVDYMLKNRLYDVSDSNVKMDSGFTTYISDYRAPFIFSKWTGSPDDIATILHELGHYTNYYYNAVVGNSTGENLDLAEVDSQALVLLLFDQYENFYGKLANQARSATLVDAMFSLLSGCMEDEFQQDVYETPDMTLVQMNALYKKLAVEYGLDEVYGYQGTEWVQIPHTFQMPFYYISYAVSMVPALELLELSRIDKDAAQTAYFNIMMRPQYAKIGEVLGQNGLEDVFSESTIAGIAEILNTYLKH